MKYTISCLLMLAVAAQAQYPYYGYAGVYPTAYSAGYPTTYSTYTPIASAPIPAPVPVAPVVQRVVPVAPAVTSTQYHSQDELGQASFGYAHPGQAATNFRDAMGNQVGSYAYINPEGKQVQVSYVADSLGFRVLSNDLPVGPVADLVAPIDTNLPVEDTAEVVEAKAAHFKAIEDFKNGVFAPLPVADVADLPVPVEDTAEVAAAKAEHAAAHAEAKAAADAAPAEDIVAPVEEVVAEDAVAAPVEEVAAAPVEDAVVVEPVADVSALPVPVEDTPEVAEAKAAHAVAHAAALAAAEASPAERKKRQIYSYGLPLPYAAAAYYQPAAPVVREAELLRVVNTPYHAVSYRLL